ncbi:MAG: peptidase M50 [Candidatus Peregrinibacteria bacterium Greene0416_19]|nr:MAG: peptidase M50 [Candidatus Peregrinibacteria bacterium Greene0416_19]
MSIILSALAFLILLTLLVMIHEVGHFLAARKMGVKVEEFGFGLPPRVKTLFWQGGTRFSFNWIPFGGFVRLQGEASTTEKQRTAKGSFGSVPVGARILILIAGVVMNFLFALLIFAIGFSVGRWIPTYLSYEEMEAARAHGDISYEPAVIIDAVVPDGEASRAAVPVPSILLSVDGTTVADPASVPELQKGKQVVLYALLTGKKFAERRTMVVPVREGKTGVSLGFYPKDLQAPRRGPVDALRLSLREAGVLVVQNVKGVGVLFRSLLVSLRVPAGITGIVGIARYTHASVQEGWMVYLQLMAQLSLSLAILNILPIPALDGGRLLFVLIEAVQRRPLNRKFEAVTNTVGFALLLLLILVITYHDVLRLF